MVLVNDLIALQSRIKICTDCRKIPSEVCTQVTDKRKVF